MQKQKKGAIIVKQELSKLFSQMLALPPSWFVRKRSTDYADFDFIVG